MSDRKEPNNLMTEKAKTAEELSQSLRQEVRLATEAMRRTHRHKKVQALEPQKYAYKEIP